MIGTVGNLSRIALDTAIAERNWGPPMTVTPTAAMEPLPTARSAVETKLRSTLPSMIIGVYLSSSAADRLSIARGNRAWRCEVIVGLIRTTQRVAGMISCGGVRANPRRDSIGATFIRSPVRLRASA